MIEKLYDVKPKEPKLLPANYTQGVDNISSEDFLKIYMETLKYQDPFQEQDLSKMLDDMVKLNQVNYFDSTKKFFDDIKGWLNQITMLSSMSLIDKSVVISTDTLNTFKNSEYYILSGDNYRDIKLRILDGDTIIKEVRLDLKKGLNPLNVSDIPRGQYTVKIYKEGLEVNDVILGVKGNIKSATILNGNLAFELNDGSLIDPSRIVHMGG